MRAREYRGMGSLQGFGHSHPFHNDETGRSFIWKLKAFSSIVDILSKFTVRYLETANTQGKQKEEEESSYVMGNKISGKG